MIKVLMLVPDLNNGGVGEVAKNIILALSDKIQFDIITNNKLTIETEKEISGDYNKIFVIKRLKDSGILKYSREIKKIMKSNQYDAIHINTDLLAWITAKLAKDCNIKIRIGNAHGQFFAHYSKLLIKLITPICQALNRYYCTDKIGCSKESIKHMFNTEGNLIPNFVCDKKIEILDRERKMLLRKEFGIENHNVVIGYSGHLDGTKNAIFLIEILNAINDENVFLVLAGATNIYDKFQSEIQKYGLSNNVKLLGHRTDMKIIYNIFDVYMTASKSEGMSMSIIQSQMMGIPCVVSNGVPDNNDLGCDLFFKCGSYEADEWKNKFNQALEASDKIDLEEIAAKIKKSNNGAEYAISELFKIYSRNSAS